jgi:cholesterol transport system auxiliary component
MKAPLRISSLLTVWAISLACLTSLSGCKGFIFSKPQAPDKHYFMLDVTPSQQTKPSGLAATRVLNLRPFRISPQYVNRGFVYRLSPVSWDSDFYNEYFLPPASMLAEETRLWLEASGLFAKVLDASSELDSTHVLESSITSLYADLSDKRNPKAILEMQFLLVEEKPGNAVSIVLHENTREEVALKDKSPTAVAEGLTQALEQTLTRLQNRIAETLPR